MECEIAGCCHREETLHTGLCKEHEIDLYYWRALKVKGPDTSIKLYITQKNRELLG